MLKTFVLVGTVISHDSFFSTVEFNLNPPVNGGPSVAVMPNHSIPCNVKVGKTIYVVKDENMDHPQIVCKLSQE
tara:strand:- start:1 stop:222 length:222 start_codon:yes stop_codon:yes gene_type:complete